MKMAIKVENLSKQYRLGSIGTGSLSHDLNKWWHTVRGKENPYLKIGETNDRTKAGESEYVWSLKDINFEIEQGDAVGIIGRNGAGKSTLLKILSRVTSPTTGTVKAKGRIASLLEVGTGFHPDLSGRENVFLNGAILGMRKQEIQKHFDEIVDFSGVERYIDTPVKRYSSGMYVRLAFAVAAYLESEILIVDEVLAVGDAEFQKKCLGKMKDVSKGEGRTVLFVSHQIGSISKLCNKGILLSNGNLQCKGYLKEVLETYIATSNKNETDYTVDFNLNRKENFFVKISCTNSKGVESANFTFDESIILRFTFKVHDQRPDLQIGIGLNDKYQNRIATVLKPVSFFKKGEEGIYVGKVEMPSKLIAPNSYVFVFALWTRQGHVFDLVENVCAIKIHDNGTHLAMYEGGDHGSVIINPQWHND